LYYVKFPRAIATGSSTEISPAVLQRSPEAHFPGITRPTLATLYPGLSAHNGQESKTITP
jgi:hypothetical protein